MDNATRAELTIDASHGEGGGQVLRTAAAIATITGRPIRMTDIHAARPKPGLAAQHITAVRAADAATTTLDVFHNVTETATHKSLMLKGNLPERF